jgi:RNA polymerase sigma-70 factor (ECF subfamily)
LADLFFDIIKRCKQGDRKAQESVYNLLAGKMFAVCLRYSTNHEDARDMLHDGFVTVFTKIGQFQYGGSFEGWVRRIFVNSAMERYRNDARLTMVDVADENSLHYAAHQLEDVDEWGAYQLTESELLAIVDELPPQYKVVFNLYVVDGLSHRDIAVKLGISESASRSNLLRARGILQKKVNDKVASMPIVNNASK